MTTVGRGATILETEDLLVTKWPSGFSPRGHFSSREAEIETYFCGDEALNDDASDMARQYSVSHSSELLGCFCIQADRVELDKSVRPPNVTTLFAPALKIARLGRNTASGHYKVRFRDGAIDTVGYFMFTYIVGLARSVNQTAAVRFLTLDALNRDDLVQNYSRWGFVRTGAIVRDEDGTALEEVNMLYDLLGWVTA